MQNVIFPLEKQAMDLYPIVHKDADADHHGSKLKSPGWTAAQAQFLSRQMLELGSLYGELDVRFFGTQAAASKKQAADNQHNVDWEQQRDVEIGGRNRLGGHGGTKKRRDREGMLAAGEAVTFKRMKAVGNQKQATGNTESSSGLANKHNVLHPAFFSNIKVKKTSTNPDACFGDFVTAIRAHHPGFSPSEAVSKSKTKGPWIAELTGHLAGGSCSCSAPLCQPAS
jgi:hypothetical protein